MKIKILISLISIILISCNNEALAKRKITKTVTNFLTAVEENNVNQCKDLIQGGHDSYGSIYGQVYFLNKNYSTINSYVNLKENIKIKDTLYVGAKMKYVQYRIKNNDSHRPLIITFIFYKQTGYDKVFNSHFVDNFLDWK